MVSSVNFKEEFEQKRQEIEEILQSYLPKETGWERELTRAVNYSVLAGGKRLRPMLMQEMYRKLGGSSRVIEPFMAAMEMIHSASLIHDDLPALDNDRYRRGKETTWVAFGETMGILSGDALLNYAYETAFLAFSIAPEHPGIGRALQILGYKSGLHGMLGGQSVDVLNEGMDITGAQLDYIYLKKTAALIEASLMIGAQLAGLSEYVVTQAEGIGQRIGLAFQIQDDILDVTSTQEELGKPVHSDEKNQKKTYVTLYGVDKARAQVEQYSREALEMLHDLPGENDFLEQLIEALITRKN